MFPQKDITGTQGGRVVGRLSESEFVRPQPQCTLCRLRSRRTRTRRAWRAAALTTDTNAHGLAGYRAYEGYERARPGVLLPLRGIQMRIRPPRLWVDSESVGVQTRIRPPRLWVDSESVGVQMRIRPPRLWVDSESVGASEGAGASYNECERRREPRRGTSDRRTECCSQHRWRLPRAA